MRLGLFCVRKVLALMRTAALRPVESGQGYCFRRRKGGAQVEPLLDAQCEGPLVLWPHSRKVLCLHFPDAGERLFQLFAGPQQADLLPHQVLQFAKQFTEGWRITAVRRHCLYVSDGVVRPGTIPNFVCCGLCRKVAGTFPEY